MPVVPNITLTANLESILGTNDATNAALSIVLCGFGNSLPAVPGQGVMSNAGVPQKISYVSGTPISATLFGNVDQIQPPSTFYCISVSDPNGNVVQAGNYRFGPGAQAVDLSSTQPNYDPSSTLGYIGYVVVPFSATPAFNGTQANVFDITLTGNVTSSTLTSINPGDIVFFFIQQDGVGGRTFAWPPNVKNPPMISPTASTTTTAAFMMRSDGFLYPWLGWS